MILHYNIVWGITQSSVYSTMLNKVFIPNILEAGMILIFNAIFASYLRGFYV